MLLRVVDFLKSHGITGVFTHLTHGMDGTRTDAGLSSLMDAWILLMNHEAEGEFNRELYLLKARGVSHSNQVREFVLSANGIRLLPPYLGEAGALTGSARRAEEARGRRNELKRRNDLARLQEQITHRRRRTQAQIDALDAELKADELELRSLAESEAALQEQMDSDLASMAESRRYGKDR